MLRTPIAYLYKYTLIAYDGKVFCGEVISGLLRFLATEGRQQTYERVMVNVPEPVQPEPPVSVQVPVIVDHVVLLEESVVPAAVPVMASELAPDFTVN